MSASQKHVRYVGDLEIEMAYRGARGGRDTYQVVLKLGRLRHKMTFQSKERLLEPTSPQALDFIAASAIKFAFPEKVSVAEAIERATHHALDASANYLVRRAPR